MLRVDVDLVHRAALDGEQTRVLHRCVCVLCVRLCVCVRESMHVLCEHYVCVGVCVHTCVLIDLVH